MATKSPAELPSVAVYPFLKHDGISFLPCPAFVEDSEKQLKRVKNFESRSTDVLLCTTMKSGTHWIHEILSMLMNRKAEYNITGVLAEINLEYTTDFNTLDELPNPRLFHTHLPYRYLPRKHIENGYKIIYLNRNPKDRWVSQYTFLSGKIGIPEWTWEEFFKTVILQDDLFDGWFKYTKTFEREVKKKIPNILKITFEEMKLDPLGTVKIIAEFVDIPCTDNFIEDIVDKCNFRNIKENKTDDSKCMHPENKPTLFRKGVIGDWKNWFTVSQNELFDELYDKEMADVDANFVYDD